MPTVVSTLSGVTMFSASANAGVWNEITTLNVPQDSMNARGKLQHLQDPDSDARRDRSMVSIAE